MVADSVMMPVSQPVGRSRVQHRGATIIFYAAFALCVVITCFTNDVIFALVRDFAHKPPTWPSADIGRLPDAAGDRYQDYLLASLKDAGFFFSLVVFGWLMRPAIAALMPELRRRDLWANTLIGLLIAAALIFAVAPAAMGRIYGYNSVEPFLQHQGFFHRRILMPVLAHDLHLGGILYGVFTWLVTLGVFALTSIYLKSRALIPTRLELASLFTTGMFATALGLPGYGEILVLGLTLIAMIDFDRAGQSSFVQPACFALSLLTHESAAVLAFGTLTLTYFDRRFAPHFAALLTLYLTIWLASYGYDAQRAVSVQLTGGTSNMGRFAQTLPLVLLSLIATYKLALIGITAAIAMLVGARNYRPAMLMTLALGGSTALTAIATDYTRMMAFGTFALLVALPTIWRPLSAHTRRWLAIANLVIPVVYVSARHGAFAYHGLYGIVLTRLFGMRWLG